MPERIQRKRTKGWRMFPGTVYVGRPSKWGNPFKVGEVVPEELVRYLTFPGEANHFSGMTRIRITSPERVVETFAYWIIEQPELMLSLSELQGHNLACWCPLTTPCHGAILLELANRGGEDEQIADSL